MTIKDMTIKEWLEANKTEYEGRYKEGIAACMDELGVSIKCVQRKARLVWGHQIDAVVNKLPVSDNDIMAPKEFILGIDIVQKIVDFLNKEVGDGYIEDSKLRRRFEVGQSKWGQIKRLPIFEGRLFIYQAKNGQRATVWSSKNGIEIAKKTISMARYEL